MRVRRKRWVPGVAGILLLLVAACGGGGGRQPVTKTILSDPTVDADVTLDLITGLLSAPSVASDTGSVLAGVSFTIPSGASTADTRGFLFFPLGDVPVGAQVQYAGLSICLLQVTLSNPASAGGTPFFLDLIDTTANAFPPPVQSSYYSVPFVDTRSFSFISADQGNCVEIEVTSLMNQAQFLLLPSFMVRVGFDEAIWQKNLDTTRGLVEIDDSVTATAPLLIVQYL